MSDIQVCIIRLKKSSKKINKKVVRNKKGIRFASANGNSSWQQVQEFSRNRNSKKAKILFGNYKKGFYICTPQTIKVVKGKVQNILREIFQKKIKFLFGD